MSWELFCAAVVAAAVFGFARWWRNERSNTQGAISSGSSIAVPAFNVPPSTAQLKLIEKAYLVPERPPARIGDLDAPDFDD